MVDIAHQVGGLRSHALLPAEWSAIWPQLPCRLRVYATQIVDTWDTGLQGEYGVGPAELHALQDMATKWWQDVQHDRQRLDLEDVTGRGQQLEADTAGRAKF